VDFILAHWQAKKRSPAAWRRRTLQTYFSHLKTFTGWIRKPESS
jgi:hypothetical protein